MCLQFGFVIFWQKDFGAKAAHKMLVKLTPNLKSVIEIRSLNQPSRLIYMSDFTAQFYNKLAHFRVLKKLFVL
jgi:hypothetical protein